MVSGVVTRKPPANSPAMPSRFSIAEICGPPPCTTTGCTPTARRNTMSAANAALRASSVIALPPYLTTMIRPRKRCSQGSVAARTAARCRRTGEKIGRVGHVEYAEFSCT